MPNLVFGLVLAEIIKVKMQVPVEIYGGLVIYTLFISMLAPLLLRTLGKGDDVDFLSTEDQIMQSLYLNQPDPKNDE